MLQQSVMVLWFQAETSLKWRCARISMFAAISAGIEESPYFFPTSAAAWRAADFVCSKLLPFFSAAEIAFPAEMMSLSPTGRGCNGSESSPA